MCEHICSTHSENVSTQRYLPPFCFYPLIHKQHYFFLQFPSKYGCDTWKKQTFVCSCHIFPHLLLYGMGLTVTSTCVSMHISDFCFRPNQILQQTLRFPHFDHDSTGFLQSFRIRFAGGSLTFTNGQAAGGMEIAGNAYFTSSSIGTPVAGVRKSQVNVPPLYLSPPYCPVGGGGGLLRGGERPPLQLAGLVVPITCTLSWNIENTVPTRHLCIRRLSQFSGRTLALFTQGWGFDSLAEVISNPDPFVSELCKVGHGGQLEGGLGPPPAIDPPPPVGRFGVRKGPGTGQLEGGGTLPGPK